MKKNVMLLCILFFLLCLLLSACSENTNSGSGMLRRGGVFANSGYYYADTQGILKYTDLSTGTTVYLCQKAGCDHTDSDICEAYVGVMGSNTIGKALYYWNDGLYYPMRDEYGTHLYRRNADGTSLSVVATLCKDYMEELREIEYYINGGTVSDGKLYYYTSVFAVVETEPHVFTAENIFDLINCIDLRTGKEETLVKKDGGRLHMEGIQDGCIYYVEVDLGDTSSENYADTAGELPARFLKYDLSTGKVTTLFKKNNHDFTVNALTGNRVYYYKVTPEGYDHYYYDLKNSTDTQFSTDQITVLNDRYALRRSKKGWDWELLDMKKEKTLPCFAVGQPLSLVNASDKGAVFDLKEIVDGRFLVTSMRFYVTFQSLADGLQKADCIVFQE